MPLAAYGPVEADFSGGCLRQAGRRAERPILAPHPDLLFNSFPRGSFLVTAATGRREESTRSGAPLPRVPCAFVNEDRHHA